LKGKEIGQGAAFTGMMRQLGGSFGVAVITTFLARQNMVHRNDLVGRLDSTNPMVIEKIKIMQHAFMAKGMAADVALKSAYKAMDYTVMKQASVISYMDVFLYLGAMFLVCIPFVLLVKNRKTQEKIDLSEAMH
jgi:DHA2 family multidrug resistance protein